MSLVKIALSYLDIFVSSENMGRILDLCVPNLSFQGPLFTFSSVQQYVDALKEDPPINCSYELIEAYENEDSVCLIYNFIKGEKVTLMSQMFSFSGNKISKITLVFDASNFR